MHGFIIRKKTNKNATIKNVFFNHQQNTISLLAEGMS